MIESHFENIDQVISQLLLKSSKTIDIASAWFTHHGLMKIIENQAVANSVKVRIIVSDDAVNTKFYPVYSQLLKSGIEIFIHSGRNQKELMHNKFAVIDSETVITGSFNWTRSAETNLENIVVSSNDSLFASKYTNEFNRIISLSGLLPPDECIVHKINSHVSLDEKTIWEFLKYFHEQKYNPTPLRIWLAMCGTKSWSIASRTSKMPFFRTMKNYANSSAVLKDLKAFFDKYSAEIASEFKYVEKGWNNINFPGVPFNFLDENSMEKIRAIKSNTIKYNRIYSDQELSLLGHYLLKTNDFSILAAILNRRESSVYFKSRRLLYDDKQLGEKWRDIQKMILDKEGLAEE
jgi:hypothetical protein